MSEATHPGRHAAHPAAREKVVGVLGGMGPEATVDFLGRIVRATPAHDDRDHIRVLVDNNPKVPSRLARLLEGGGEDPLPVLISMALGLESLGADFLTIPCNTAHHYLPDIAGAVHIPVLDMVALTAVRLTSLTPVPRRVGVLASPAVRKIGLYARQLARVDVTALFPEGGGEQVLLDLIRAVKARAVTDALRAGYADTVRALIEDGAEALLIACTELSVLGSPAHDGPPVIDTLDVLVAETVRTARGQEGS